MTNVIPVLVIVDDPASASTGLAVRNTTDTAVAVPQVERRWRVDGREVCGVPILPPGQAIEVTRDEMSRFAGNSILRVEG